MRGRWQLTTTAGSMQASPSLTLVVWFAIAIVGGGRRIQLASRGGVETSPNACRGPRQNYRFGAIAPGTILSSKDPLRGCNTKKRKGRGIRNVAMDRLSHLRLQKGCDLNISPLHPFHLDPSSCSPAFAPPV